MRISDWSSDVCSSDLRRLLDVDGGDRLLRLHAVDLEVHGAKAAGTLAAGLAGRALALCAVAGHAGKDRDAAGAALCAFLHHRHIVLSRLGRAAKLAPAGTPCRARAADRKRTRLNSSH